MPTAPATSDRPKPDKRFFVGRFPVFGRVVRRFGLRGKLLLALLPPIVAVLLATGYASYTVTEEFIDIALERTVKLHTLAVAHEVEQYLDECRRDLLFLARGDLSADGLQTVFERRMGVGGKAYFELCFVPATGGDPVAMVRQGDIVRRMGADGLAKVRPNPFAQLDMLASLADGQVEVSDVVEVTYPMPTAAAANRYETRQVIRLVTRVPGSDTTPPGLLFISLEAAKLRNILSWYNSDKSPLWAFPRSDELRFSYFLNRDGWMLFQSEDYAQGDKPLTTYLARENFSGTLGKAGQEAAFRPNEKYLRYWTVVEDIRKGESGLRKVAQERGGRSAVDSYYFGYAPVVFLSVPGREPEVLGGVVFVDRSQLPVVAGYKNLDVMLFVTIGAIILISFFIFWFGRILTKPIRELAAEVNSISSLEDMEEIRLPYSGFDITTLQESINNIIRRVRHQVEEIQARDEVILNVNKRERASLDREKGVLAEAELSRIPEIVGTGPAIANLKVNILKAAQVDVDVLITGETGTGKQLVAEAVHNHGSRSEKPFVSINCGALDENLLLDALFGHVKGAFSEAKDDRNGAFVEADGGTLFLDEIQSASPKVQQSLLRALASRRIKPLGSDRELVVDVRIVAATNVDIPSLIENRTFREDLYYRLKVVSITTPALREHRENIPLLSVYYLRQAEQLAGRETLDLSKGALAKLVAYDWPGNVRELVNCITRAAVMAETDIIQVEEIRLENEAYALYPVPDAQEKDSPEPEDAPRSVPDRPAIVKPSPAEPELNPRQKEAWPQIRKRERVTRKEYQDMVGGDLSSRTAIYDLQDFVKRGLLIKRGRGPSTTYEVVG
ncbi:sigma 54-interacting transcriptional regulator [Pseudodesulfovibrio portus]|uniref:Membrane protein n=1 Tax=Pseudodesulfovibrio portus TaxID=231439 RepID=A0ABM8ATT4_9BACT|nr:sigma-54 dependent transcriptional regulator [Pseudodesulfovibrio portus]BDQ34846.1 membrane protein [Pseudodesulfovibrio portus]